LSLIQQFFRGAWLYLTASFYKVTYINNGEMLFIRIGIYKFADITLREFCLFFILQSIISNASHVTTI